MTAPTLVLLGYGSRDARTAPISDGIRAELTALRPELDVAVAFLESDDSPTADGGPDQPSAATVAADLARRGVAEVVLVPLLLSDAFGAHPEIPAAVAGIRAAHPGLSVIASRPVGPEAGLLSVVDRRLRDSIRARRVSELDGLVFSAAGSADLRSNAVIARRARQWATHHRLPCVTAYATGSGPSTAEAVRTLRAQGRRHIAVGSWFLAPGELYQRQAELALEAGAVAVSAPLGAGPEVAQSVLCRYVVAAIDLVDLEPAVDEEPVPVRHLSVVSA